MSTRVTIEVSRARCPSQDVGGVRWHTLPSTSRPAWCKMKRMVAVQDMGLIINRTTAESQIYGAMHEHRCEPVRAAHQRSQDGRFVERQMVLSTATAGRHRRLVVHLHEPESERARGVIGLASRRSSAAQPSISNAVCNAIGVRVPNLPLTPKRVLDALRTAKG